MIQKDSFAIIFGTFYLLIYLLFLQIEALQQYAMVMFLISPFMLVWMVYMVLKFGKYNGPALGEDEFGYQDKNKDELGVF